MEALAGWLPGGRAAEPGPIGRVQGGCLSPSAGRIGLSPRAGPCVCCCLVILLGGGHVTTGIWGDAWILMPFFTLLPSYLAVAIHGTNRYYSMMCHVIGHTHTNTPLPVPLCTSRSRHVSASRQRGVRRPRRPCLCGPDRLGRSGRAAVAAGGPGPPRRSKRPIALHSMRSSSSSGRRSRRSLLARRRWTGQVRQQ